MILTYTDAYLVKNVTQAREDRALLEVDAIGTFPADANQWRERLGVIRAYIITCLDCQSTPEDLFGTKLGHYRKEFTSLLEQAQAAQIAAQSAQNSAAGLPGVGLYSVALERA